MALNDPVPVLGVKSRQLFANESANTNFINRYMVGAVYLSAYFGVFCLSHSGQKCDQSLCKAYMYMHTN